jgi:hypothetical protein
VGLLISIVGELTALIAAPWFTVPVHGFIIHKIVIFSLCMDTGTQGNLKTAA